jgi:hypothetical protein
MKASKFSDAQKAFILKQGTDGMPVADGGKGQMSEGTRLVRDLSCSLEVSGWEVRRQEHRLSRRREAGSEAIIIISVSRTIVFVHLFNASPPYSSR